MNPTQLQRTLAVCTSIARGGLTRTQADICSYWHRQSSTAAQPSAKSEDPPSTSQASTSDGSQPQPRKQPLYAACILERLPVVMPQPAEWEQQYATWSQQQHLQQNVLVEYPDVSKTLRPEADAGAGGLQQDSGVQKQFAPVSSQTAADTLADVRTMKRKLDERLYMLVKQKVPGNRTQWHFPFVELQGSEAVSDAAERALHTAIGRKYPVYFYGKAPVAHLPLMPTGGAMFYLMAQVVNDPWPVQLQPGGGAEDYVWVTKAEMPHYLGDARLRELARKMLA